MNQCIKLNCNFKYFAICATKRKFSITCYTRDKTPIYPRFLSWRKDSLLIYPQEFWRHYLVGIIEATGSVRVATLSFIFGILTCKHRRKTSLSQTSPFLKVAQENLFFSWQKGDEKVFPSKSVLVEIIGWTVCVVEVREKWGFSLRWKLSGGIFPIQNLTTITWKSVCKFFYINLRPPGRQIRRNMLLQIG